MELRTITIDDTKLLINDELVEHCSVSGFHVEQENAEDELVSLTLTLVSPKTKVVIAGLSLD